MKRILISGGAGFIGSHLVATLLELGHEVICLDNLVTGTQAAVDRFASSPRFSFISHDVTQALPAIEGELQWIFHLASPASPHYDSPISYHALPMETMLVNTQGTKNMLDVALAKHARFLFTSTSEIYGDPLEHPQRESYRGNVSTTGPRSIYDEAKRFGETITAYYHRAKGVDIRIARIFNTYGPGIRPDDQRMLTNFILQALKNEPLTINGDGTQTRSLCYVKDTVKGLIRLMDQDGLAGGVVNIGNPEERTVNEYAQFVLKEIGATSQPNYLPTIQDDPQRRQPDISKAHKLLGWQPETSFEVGLRETIAYYRALLGPDSVPASVPLTD